jgi:choline dehydrogenase
MDHSAEYEYVVVGSGAGGGTVAARLALAGRKVFVLEAGGDAAAEDTRTSGSRPRLPEDYRVPCFHAFSTENDEMKWDYFVRHYSDDEQQRLDDNYRKEHNGKVVDGVLYPRAGTLGGCTSHNAMLTVYPHNADWDNLAALTGDPSWSAGNMRKYFERMENCHYRPVQRWLRNLLRWNPSRHGFSGWLNTEEALPEAALEDKELVKCLKESARAAFKQIGQPLRRVWWALVSKLDPNDWRLVKDNAVGIRLLPLATACHCRNGTREFLLDVARKYPERLHIELNALATRVLLDGDNRAIGVEYLKGERLFRAHAKPSEENGEPRIARAAREVILSGGAFNTPQLLMLSGIGPRCQLEKHAIRVRVDLPGVGRNLQDRYEVGVVNRMKQDWGILKGAKFASGDPIYEQWNKLREGVYTTNGAVLAVIKKSNNERPLPDLFMFALMGKFRGYFPGYSKLFVEHLDYLTWAILKAHTNNTAGEVTLRSADPRDPPAINFHYFEEGNDAAKEDLESVVDGILFVRTMTEGLGGLMDKEELPGKDLKSREDLRRFIRNNAWGHHASCTCPIGPREKGGVLNGNFEVHGVQNLRVVDASVFPRIPGFFIATSVYMVGEKASDVILRE